MCLYFAVVYFIPDLSEKKSDLQLCDKSSCRYDGICSADHKCVCKFKVKKINSFYILYHMYSYCTLFKNNFIKKFRIYAIKKVRIKYFKHDV